MIIEPTEHRCELPDRFDSRAPKIGSTYVCDACLLAWYLEPYGDTDTIGHWVKCPAKSGRPVAAVRPSLRSHWRKLFHYPEETT